MKVEKGKKVTIEYELTLPDGSVLESSAQRGPLEFVIGQGSMLPAFEARIEGMAVDEERDGTIPSKEAVGDEDALIKVIDRSEFPADAEITVGQQFEANSPNGPVSFRVEQIEDDKVTVRFVHPLAGKDISYKVKVLAISDPD